MAKIITHQTWKQRIKTASRHSITLAMCIVTALTILLTAPAASLAAIQSPAQSPALLAALQTTPFKEQPATLTSPREGAAIPLYIRPAPNQQPVGYGISGDPVTITDQFGDYLMEDDPSATWSHIRLNNAPYTEGWLRGRFLLPKTQEE